MFKILRTKIGVEQFVREYTPKNCDTALYILQSVSPIYVGSSGISNQILLTKV